MQREELEPTTAAEADRRECRVVDLALSGKLAAAGREAIADYQRLGLPRVMSRDGKLIQVDPDGREQVLDDIVKVPFKRPPNVALLEPR